MRVQGNETPIGIDVQHSVCSILDIYAAIFSLTILNTKLFLIFLVVTSCSTVDPHLSEHCRPEGSVDMSKFGCTKYYVFN